MLAHARYRFSRTCACCADAVERRGFVSLGMSDEGLGLDLMGALEARRRERMD